MNTTWMVMPSQKGQTATRDRTKTRVDRQRYCERTAAVPERVSQLRDSVVACRRAEARRDPALSKGNVKAAGKKARDASVEEPPRRFAFSLTNPSARFPTLAVSRVRKFIMDVGEAVTVCHQSLEGKTLMWRYLGGNRGHWRRLQSGRSEWSHGYGFKPLVSASLAYWEGDGWQ